MSDDAEIELVARGALAQVYGLGPLQALLDDPRVNEIMVNNGGDVWIGRHGVLSRAGHLDADVAVVDHHGQLEWGGRMAHGVGHQLADHEQDVVVRRVVGRSQEGS